MCALFLDWETAGLDYSAEVYGLAVHDDNLFEGDPWWIPFDTLEKFQEEVNELIECTKGPIVFHNAAFDLSHFDRLGIKVPRERVHDTMLMSYLLDPSRGENSLDYWGAELKCPKGSIVWKDFLADPRTRLQKAYDPELIKYALQDIRVTETLWQHLVPLFKERCEANPKFREMYFAELKYMQFLITCRHNGYQVDLAKLPEAKLRIETLLDEAKGKLSSPPREIAYVKQPADNRKKHKNALGQMEEHLFCNYPETNWNSGAHKMHHLKRVGWYSTGQTATGNEACGSDSLEPFIHEQSPRGDLCRLLKDYQILQKLLSTYLSPISEKSTADGILRGDFNQCVTKTKRLSCVSGRTLLTTSRGIFEIQNYLPQKGDKVQTHTGSFQRVLWKIYKGTEEMYRVVLEDKKVVECTLDHQFLTPTGWRSLRGIIKETFSRQGSLQKGSGIVLVRGEAHETAASGELENGKRECYGDTQTRTLGRTIQMGAEPTLFKKQDRKQEPYVGQKWYPTPQLEGGMFRQERLPDNQGRGEEGLCASLCDGAASRASYSCSDGCSPHRRESFEQLYRQPGTSHQGSASRFALEERRIIEVTSLGQMAVWDISVERDHSYFTDGIVSHNSSDPNLQNLARRGEYGGIIREVFIARPGYTFGSCDLDQIEFRMVAHFMAKEMKDYRLLEPFLQGVDVHAYNQKVWGIATRDDTKILTYSLIFGGGPRVCGGGDVKKGKKMLDAFHKANPNFEKWKENVVAKARRAGGEFYNDFGSLFTIPNLNSEDRGLRSSAERSCISCKVQGAAGDVFKTLTNNAYEQWGSLGIIYHGPVHDEITFSIPLERSVELSEQIKNSLYSPPGGMLLCAVQSQIKLGDNWKECH